MAAGRVRGFSIATKCATLDELIEKYRDRVDETSILVNTVQARDIGTECAFAILLADKTIALAGTCTVLDVFSDASNPFKRPGMRLGIQRLGPGSQHVFAQLVARRIPPRRLTTAIPIRRDSIPARAATSRGAEIPDPGPRRMTPPVRDEHARPEVVGAGPRRPPVVQIPPRADEPLARAPRATPSTLGYESPAPAASTPRHVEAQGSAQPARAACAPLHVTARGSAQPAQTRERTTPVAPAPPAEARTPGSSYVLPANPLSNLTDATLEGFIDGKLLESQPTNARPATFPAGTRDELETIAPAITDARAVSPRASGVTVPRHVEPARSEPLPLPPPPAVRPTTLLPLPYTATALPELPAGATDARAGANVRIPRVSRRLRNQLVLAFALVPLIGAAAVIVYMQWVAAPALVAAPAMPATVAMAEATEQVRGTVEPPPPAPPPAPPRRQPIHAVLVKTYPIAARVTVGDRYFGTTPTYVKIPANTPVELRIERRGFKPVTYPLISKKRTDRVFVRLQRARARARARARRR